MDYHALFLLTPSPLMVMDTELVIRDVNAAYLAATGRSRDTLIGWYIFDAFPTPEDDEAINAIAQSFHRALDSGQTDLVPLVHYPVPRYDAQGQQCGFDDRYWSCTHVPLHNAAGELTGLMQQTEDVTALQRLRQKAESVILAAEPEAMQALGGTVLRRAQQVQQINTLLDAESQHLRRLFAQAPGFLAVLRGPALTLELVNEAMVELVGDRMLLGRPFADALPELAERGFADVLAQVLATGEPYIGRGLTGQLQRHPEAPPTHIVVNLTCQPVIEADGHVSGIFVLGQDITVQHRAEAELARYREHLEALVLERTYKLSELAGYLQRVGEQERHRLARELHDELGSLLTAIKLDLSWVRRQLPEAAPEALQEKLTRAMALLDDGISLKRRLIENLRPSALLHLGLLDALQLLLDDHGGRDNNCEFTLAAATELPRLNDDAALALYRIAQESLNNAAKYAHAASVTVRLAVDAGWLEMAVVDDGRGCDPDDVRSRPVGHHGLIGMEQRLLAFGGELRLISRLGSGCTVLARMPLDRVLHAEAA